MPPLRHLSLFALLLAGSLACRAEPIILQAAQLKSLGIETTSFGSTPPGRGGGLPGRVVVPTEQLRVVAAPVAGMVEMLAVAPGSDVRRGQVVARLASPQALELQRDALQSASQAGLQQQNLARDEALFAEGLIAESRLQASRSAAAQAAAQASERRQGLALAGVAAGKLGGPLALSAPIDGVVLEQGVQLGQRVDASTVLYRIARLSPLWLEIQAPLAAVAGLQIGAPVRLAGSGIAGKLIAIGRAIDPASQTVLLRASVGNGAEQLTPGQVVEVELPGASGSHASLPAGALIRDQGKTYVFIQGADSERGTSFAARPVRLLGQGGDSITVDGIKAGEKVVTRGASSLKAMLAGVGKE